jgi:hypothetical protein
VPAVAEENQRRQRRRERLVSVRNLDLNTCSVLAFEHLEARMDHRKKAMILDGATDLYTLIREILGMVRGDARVARLDQATERYLKDVLALEDRDEPRLRVVEGLR